MKVCPLILPVIFLLWTCKQENHDTDKKLFSETNGYPGQFGGSKGRKLKYGRLKYAS